MNLQGKRVLITGGSRGIGRAIVTLLASEGATVYATATTQKGSDAISAYLLENGWLGQGFELDVQDKEQVTRVFEEIREKGVVDILINNAGMTRDNLFLRMKEEEWDSVIATNLSSVFYLTKLCLRDMLKSRWGRIVNISSVVGTSGNAGQANYAAAKAGVEAMTKSLAQEVASRAITVNAVAPGFIDTDMTRSLTEEQSKLILSGIPAGRMGSPGEVAACVGFLVSNQADYITGQTIHVNGGLLMR